MTPSTKAPTSARRTRSPASPSTPAQSRRESTPGDVGITVFGCGQDEAARFREAAARFGVVPTITEAAPSEANANLALGNRCVSVGHKTTLADATLLALRRAGVRYLSTRSIGYDHIPLELAERIGITVGNVMYSPDSVGDYTVMLMLMLIRHARSTISRAEVHDYRLDDHCGKELRDLTVGIIGTGRIGGAVIDRLRPFGCRLLACDPRPTRSVRYVSLDELLRRSDLVTLHTPLSAETHHLLDHERIRRMKPGAFIVNAGRGCLLDTEALLEALESGRLGGAALDVLEGEEGVFYANYSREPVTNQRLLRLQRLPNVLITPHTAYFTDRSLRDMAEGSIINCLKFEGRA